MKYLLTLAIVFCSVLMSIGQNNDIVFTGLTKAGQSDKVACSSIHYEATKKISSGRASGTITMTMSVERNQDKNSPAIENAMQIGKTIGSAIVSVREGNGKVKKYKIENIAIIEYEGIYSNGKNAKEVFTIFFTKKTPI